MLTGEFERFLVAGRRGGWPPPWSNLSIGRSTIRRWESVAPPTCGTIFRSSCS